MKIINLLIAANNNQINNDRVELARLINKYPNILTLDKLLSNLNPGKIGNYLWFVRFELSMSEYNVKIRRNDIREV